MGFSVGLPRRAVVPLGVDNAKKGRALLGSRGRKMAVEEPPEEAQEYPVKRGHKAKTDLAEVMEDAFGEAREVKERTAEHEPDEWLQASYALIRSVEARYYKKSTLWVINDQKSPEEIDFEKELEDIERTREAWNRFLREATGYSAKERSKKMKERAKES